MKDEGKICNSPHNKKPPFIWRFFIRALPKFVSTKEYALLLEISHFSISLNLYVLPGKINLEV
jgi:hypothetical protein